MFQGKLMSTVVASLVAGFFFVIAPTCASAAEPFVVQFRLNTWKTMHFDESSKAAAHLATLHRLGCEAKAERHEGHTDIVYRCPHWRRLAVKTDAGAHQWENWLRACGFETVHMH